MIEKLLEERGAQHGRWADHSDIAQQFKELAAARFYDKLSRSQREALEMIFHKIGRILAGNPNHRDHWDDIAGYATLASKEIGGDAGPLTDWTDVKNRPLHALTESLLKK